MSPSSRVLLQAVLILATASAGARALEPQHPAAMPQSGSKAFIAAGVEQFSRAKGRGRDQVGNLAYLTALAPLLHDLHAGATHGPLDVVDAPYLHDPFRVHWSPARGEELDAHFRNRYGAQLEVHLWSPKLPFTDPVSGRIDAGALPTVILVPGYGITSAGMYEGIAQQLAERGYLVAAVNPQGQGGSESEPDPHSQFCEPAARWKQPQEAGLREPGTCAGHDGPRAALSGQFAEAYRQLVAEGAESIAWSAQTRLEPLAAIADRDDDYRIFRHRFVFAAFDFADWLVSPANPWRTRVDTQRLGIVGHSAGADAAYVTAQADRRHRFKAVAAWDATAMPPDTFTPSVPTLWQNSELQEDVGPLRRSLPPAFVPARDVFRQLRARDVPVFTQVLGGSTHQEWNYIPCVALCLETEGANASSLGMQVAEYYTLAWLDRWLKAEPGAHPRGDEPAQLASARARLLARNFDDSADRTSIGQGTYDARTGTNAPYRIAGRAVGDALSIFLLSQIAFDGITCLDWKAGCQ